MPYEYISVLKNFERVQKWPDIISHGFLPFCCILSFYHFVHLSFCLFVSLYILSEVPCIALYPQTLNLKSLTHSLTHSPMPSKKLAGQLIKKLKYISSVSSMTVRQWDYNFFEKLCSSPVRRIEMDCFNYILLPIFSISYFFIVGKHITCKAQGQGKKFGSEDGMIEDCVFPCIYNGKK